MTNEDVTQIVLEEREWFLKFNSHKYALCTPKFRYEAINRGSCFDLAEMIYREILNRLSIEPKSPIIHTIHKIDTFMFTTETGHIKRGNLELLYDFPEMILDIESLLMPPELYNIITFQELIDMHMFLGNHCFVWFDGLMYDSECPQGVKHVFEIPFFKRTLDVYIMMKNRKRGTLKVLSIENNGFVDMRFFLGNKEISPAEADGYRGTMIDFCTCDDHWNILRQEKRMLFSVNNYKPFELAAGANHVSITYLKDDNLIQKYKSGQLSEFDGSPNYYIPDNIIELAVFDMPGMNNCRILFYCDEKIQKRPVPAFTLEYRGINLCKIELLRPVYRSGAKGYYGLTDEQKAYLNKYLRRRDIEYTNGLSVWEYICDNWNSTWQEFDNYPTINYLNEIQPDYRRLR